MFYVDCFWPRDELAGWFGSFDKYTKVAATRMSRSGFQMHNGDAVCVDRQDWKSTRHPCRKGSPFVSRE